MIIALTIWNGRIAPVFDVAGTVKLVEKQKESTTDGQTVNLPDDNGMISRVNALQALGIDVLVCGAISRAVHRMIVSSGIEVYSFISGDADEVLKALLEGNLTEKSFLMPGCRLGRGNGQGGCRRGAGNRGRGRNRGFRDPTGRKEV